MSNPLNSELAAPSRVSDNGPSSRWFKTRLTHLWVPAVLFALSFAVFYRSPVVQVGDSHYSMLLSLNLARHGSFILDRYFIPPREPAKDPNHFGLDLNLYPNDYVVFVQDHHYFYSPPPGTSVLSVPFIMLFDRVGLASAKPDNTYDRNAEVKIQRLLAALLMALYIVLCFYLSRSFLPPGWSVLIACATAFGTPIWSTATRAMWGHTWSVLLLGIAIKILVDQELGKRRLNPYLLATLLSWMYFVRPSSAVMITAITIYILLRQRSHFLKLALTGSVWLGLFLAYSQHYFHQWLPDYFYIFNDFGTSHGYFKALAGLLISPSRGILTYVPILFAVLVLLARYWRVLACRPLVWLAIVCITGTLLMYAATYYWHGGESFGPRYSTDSIPWWVLLSILTVHALRSAEKQAPGPGEKKLRRFGIGMGFSVLLLGLGVFIHARGAMAYATGHTWSILPRPMELDIGRVWDWRRPQFMEGLTAISRRLARPSDAGGTSPLAVNPDAKFPVLYLGDRINLLSHAADDYLLNFSPSSPVVMTSLVASAEQNSGTRCTLTQHAEIHFKLDQQNTVQLRMYVQPFLLNGKLDAQRVVVTLNGNSIASFTLREPGWRPYTITLPRNFWKKENTLSIDLPDAVSQTSLGIVHGDDIIRGVCVQWMELIREPAENEAPQHPVPPPIFCPKPAK